RESIHWPRLPSQGARGMTTLTDATQRILNRGRKVGPVPIAAFAVDGGRSLSGPGTRAFRNLIDTRGAEVIGSCDGNATVTDLVDDLSCFFTDDEVRA